MAVADLDEPKLEVVRRRYPAVKTTTDFQDLLTDPSIDAVAIATPVSTHFEFGMAALTAGKHLWVEKPMTETSLGEYPIAVSASGTNHFPGTPANLAHITLFYASGTIAHANVSWLAPVKVRQILVGGSKKMIIYDDVEPSEKIKVYDKGVSFTDDPQQIHEMRVGYRTGDMWAPKLAGTEALSVGCEHFLDCIDHSKLPETDGNLGMRVVTLGMSITFTRYGAASDSSGMRYYSKRRTRYYRSRCLPS